MGEYTDSPPKDDAGRGKYMDLPLTRRYQMSCFSTYLPFYSSQTLFGNSFKNALRPATRSVASVITKWNFSGSHAPLLEPIEVRASVQCLWHSHTGAWELGNIVKSIT